MLGATDLAVDMVDRFAAYLDSIRADRAFHFALFIDTTKSAARICAGCHRFRIYPPGILST
jgi:hypothetical protein